MSIFALYYHTLHLSQIPTYISFRLTISKLFLIENVRGGNYRKWFLVVWRWDICPKLPRIGPKNEKLLNQFNNFCYLRTSFDLKMQGLFETNKHRQYLKCGTKFYKKSISRLQIIIFAIQITGQNWLYFVWNLF